MGDEEDKDAVEGPTMLVATSMLKAPPPVQSLKIIPRTLPWPSLIIIVLSALLGFTAMVAVVGTGMESLIYGCIIGGAAGWAVPQLSPLKGESVSKSLRLQTATMTAERVRLDGRRVRLYVGTQPLRRVALGHVRLVPAGVSVQADSYDERGYPRIGEGTKRSRDLVKQHSNPRKKKKQLKPAATLAMEKHEDWRPPLPKQKPRKKKQLTASGTLEKR